MGYNESTGLPEDVTRIRAYFLLIKDAWSTFGLPTIMLVIMLLLWTGMIPSPLSEARVVIDDLKLALDKHLERDEEIIFYMKSMCISNATLAKTPIEDCLWRQARHK